MNILLRFNHKQMQVTKERANFLKILHLELRIKQIKPTTTTWGKPEILKMIKFENKLRKCLKEGVTDNDLEWVTNNFPPPGDPEEDKAGFAAERASSIKTGDLGRNVGSHAAGQGLGSQSHIRDVAEDPY